MQGDPPGDPAAASGARAGLSAHPRKSPAEPDTPDGTAAPQVSRLAAVSSFQLQGEQADISVLLDLQSGFFKQK